MKVAIIDDDACILSVYKLFFSQQNNLECAFFQNGTDALKFLSEHKMDLIISDLNLPDLDGLELCMTVRKRYDFQGIFLLATGALPPADFRKYGITEVIEKPFEFQEIMSYLITLPSDRRMEKNISDFSQNS